MTECNHEFITYANGKFGCRDCEYCEDYLPDDEPIRINPKAADIRDMITGFTEGMATLFEAAEAAKISVQEFAAAVKTTFRPRPIIERVQALGGQSFVQVTGYQPNRVSCPLAVDEFFSNTSDMNNIPFGDITNIIVNSETPSLGRLGMPVKLQPFQPGEQHWEITFIDGSIQRIDL